jgi:hypothetical protein
MAYSRDSFLLITDSYSNRDTKFNEHKTRVSTFPIMQNQAESCFSLVCLTKESHE